MLTADLSEMRRAVERYDGTYVSLSKPTVLALLDVVEAASDPAVFDFFSDTTMYLAHKRLAAALSPVPEWSAK